jgi:hypothetical protein
MNNCECGRHGAHPYPIGGGWAMACNKCRRESIELHHTTSEDWTTWAREAFVGPSIRDLIWARIQDRLAHQRMLGEYAAALWRSHGGRAGV